jgi:hypothetical protein
VEFFVFEEQYKEEGNKVKRNQKGKCVKKKEKKAKGQCGNENENVANFYFFKSMDETKL